LRGVQDFSMKQSRPFAVSLILSGLLCTVVTAFAAESKGGAASPDPIAYCKSVGTRDTVRPMRGSQGTFWRCMDGQVFVCVVGANIPCQAKADISRRNAGAQAFCREHPDAEIVPAYATGHRTIYEWRCMSGTPLRGKAVQRLDRRGFQADFWHPLAPDGSG
jgi:hypothetical protein